MTQSIATFTDENLRPTPIQDYRHQTIEEIARRLDHSNRSQFVYVQAAHRLLSIEVAPVYTVDELQPASRTIAKQKGSCSQRFACLEALARARSIATRVRGRWIAGSFWAPRFRLTRAFIPRRILLAWPEFYLDERWVGVESLFQDVQLLATQNPHGFANDGESIFDAIQHAAVDFDGKTRGCSNGQCDLSHFAIAEAGIFASRDDLFSTYPLFQKTIRGKAFEILYGGRKSK